MAEENNTPEMDGTTKAELTATVINIIATHGIPALVKFVNGLADQSAITVEVIQALQGELDAKDYFPDLE